MSVKGRVHKEIFHIDEIEWQVMRSSGPGGQNVNRTNSAVLLRWKIEECAWLTDTERERVLLRLERRFTNEGEILIKAEEFRDQERNRQMALERLVELLDQALFVQKPRKKTKPTFSSKQKRIKTKKARGDIKRNRQTKNWD